MVSSTFYSLGSGSVRMNLAHLAALSAHDSAHKFSGGHRESPAPPLVRLLLEEQLVHIVKRDSFSA
jgi:hypothetical protein